MCVLVCVCVFECVCDMYMCVWRGEERTEKGQVTDMLYNKLVSLFSLTLFQFLLLHCYGEGKINENICCITLILYSSYHLFQPS